MCDTTTQSYVLIVNKRHRHLINPWDNVQSDTYSARSLPIRKKDIYIYITYISNDVLCPQSPNEDAEAGLVDVKVADHTAVIEEGDDYIVQPFHRYLK